MEQTQTLPAERVRRAEEEMFNLIAEHRAGAQTVKAFCESHDLTPGIYYYWQKKYEAKHSLSATGRSGFTLLQVQDMPPSDSALFAEVNGIKIYRAVPAGYLKELIH